MLYHVIDCPYYLPMLYPVLFTQYGYFAIGRKLDDSTGLMGLLLIAPALANIVYGLQQTGVDVAEVLCRRIAGDIGRRAHDGFLKTVTQLMAEWLVGDTQSYRAIGSYQIGGQINGIVKYNGRWLVYGVYQLPCHVGHVAHITLQTVVAVYKANQRF